MQEALETYLEDLDDLAIMIKGCKDGLGSDKGIETSDIYRQLKSNALHLLQNVQKQLKS